MSIFLHVAIPLPASEVDIKGMTKNVHQFEASECVAELPPPPPPPKRSLRLKQRCYSKQYNPCYCPSSARGSGSQVSGQEKIEHPSSIQHMHTHTQPFLSSSRRQYAACYTPHLPDPINKPLAKGGDEVKLLVQALTYFLHELLRLLKAPPDEAENMYSGAYKIFCTAAVMVACSIYIIPIVTKNRLDGGKSRR